MAQSGREFFEQRYAALGGRIVDVKLPVCIRINTLREGSIVDRLKSLGIVLDKVGFLNDAYYVRRSGFSVGAITEHLLGYYYIQSAAAQLPAVVLQPKSSETVLDMCAAPGGKLTQMAALMDNRGSLFAFELKRERIMSLSTNLERCGVKNCVAFFGDASRSQKLNIQFDKILLDAPCSGNFVSDPDWFKIRTMDGIKRSAAIQKRLLRIAVNVLKPGGTLVYSTCSLDPLENESNIQWALDNLPVRLQDTALKVGDPGLTDVFNEKLSNEMIKTRRLWPHKTMTEGFFIAKLVKNERG